MGSLGSELNYGSIDELGARDVPDLPVDTVQPSRDWAFCGWMLAALESLDSIHGKGSPWDSSPRPSRHLDDMHGRFRLCARKTVCVTPELDGR